jgi:hypothetical protein
MLLCFLFSEVLQVQASTQPVSAIGNTSQLLLGRSQPQLAKLVAHVGLG